jgi:hypothetical protein
MRDRDGAYDVDREDVARTVARFVETCCSFDPDARVPSAALRVRYAEWAVSCGVLDAFEAGELAQALRRRGARPMRTARVRGWLGVRLTETPKPRDEGGAPAVRSARPGPRSLP